MTKKISDDLQKAIAEQKETERQILISLQLDNVCKLLGDGELHHKTIVNSRGEVKYQYTITYTKEQ